MFWSSSLATCHANSAPSSFHSGLDHLPSFLSLCPPLSIDPLPLSAPDPPGLSLSLATSSLFLSLGPMP